MKIREERLIPYALNRLKESAAKADITSDAFRESLAEELFQLHRGATKTEFKAKVQERTWREIPNAQKGKYRKIVDDAKTRFTRSQRRKRV